MVNLRSLIRLFCVGVQFGCKHVIHNRELNDIPPISAIVDQPFQRITYLHISCRGLISRYPAPCPVCFGWLQCFHICLWTNRVWKNTYHGSSSVHFLVDRVLCIIYLPCQPSWVYHYLRMLSMAISAEKTLRISIYTALVATKYKLVHKD